MTAAVHGWNQEFKGVAAKSLFKIMSVFLSPATEPYAIAPYARATCIINSSGTGKSRMVDQLSTFIITVPMCLRPDGSRGIITLFFLIFH